MIDVIGRSLTQTKIDQIAGGGHHIFPSQNPGQKIGLQSQFLVQLMPTHPTNVVAFRIKKEPLEQGFGVRHRGWIAGPQPPIDLF